MNADTSSPLYDAETQALIGRLAEAQAALEARLGSQVDTATDPANGRPILLRATWEALEQDVQDRTEELRAPNKELLAARKEAEIQRRCYQELFDQAPDAYLVTDLWGMVQEANQAASELLGVPKEQLVGTPLYICQAPAQRAAFDDRLRALCNGTAGVVQNWETRIARRQGTSVDVLVSVIPMVAPTGERIGLRWLIRDISELKRTEQALHVSERKFSLLFDKSHFPMTLTKLPDCAVVDINEASVQLFGYSKEEAVGKTSVELGMQPDLETQARTIAQLKEGHPVRDVQYTLHTKSGQTCVVSFNADIIDIAGQELVLNTIQDITERKRAEEALRASEERFRLFMDHSPAIAWIKDEQGRHVYLNKTHEDFFGVHLEDWRGKTDAQLWPAEIAQAFRQNDLAVLATGRALEVVEETVDASGSHRHCLSTKFPFCDAAGNRFVAGIGIDITDRRRAEEALSRYAQRLSVLHEVDRALLAARTEQEVIEAVLSRASHLLPCFRCGVSAYDLEARRTVLLAVHGTGAEMLPAGRTDPWGEKWLPLLEKLARGKELVFEDMQALALAEPDLARFQLPGMRAVIVEPLWVQGQWGGVLSLSLTVPGPLPPEYLEVARGLSTALSIGLQQARLYEQVQQHTRNLQQRVEERTRELAQRTAELELSEERFRAFVTASSDVVYRMSSDWREMRHLQGREFIPDTDSPSGTWLETYIHPDDQPHVQQAIQEAIRTKSMFELEHRVRRVDGTLGWTYSRAVPRLDANGEIIEWFGAAQDITARKQAQEALVQAERMATIGRVGTSLAHEVNNPIQSVVGCLGLAAELLEEDNEATRYLQVAMEELERAARIVREMRNLGRRDEGRKEPANISGLVQKVLLLTRKRAQNCNVEVAWDGAEGLPLVLVVAERIQQVLLNLVLNAIDAMPDGGKLSIRTKCTAGPPGIEIAVSDTGEGIPPERLETLFEPFQSSKKLGMGMGLYVSRGIIREHDGHIDVQSEAGKGTTLTIWLPGE